MCGLQLHSTPNDVREREPPTGMVYGRGVGEELIIREREREENRVMENRIKMFDSSYVGKVSVLTLKVKYYIII